MHYARQDAAAHARTPTPAEAAIICSLIEASSADTQSCYDLGIALSTGSCGAQCDLIEAHKWFNLAALNGHAHAARCRADVALEMSAREIAEAQRRAREWLRMTGRRSA